MVSPSVDHLWFIAQPRLLHWWWSYRLICSSISLASLSQAMFQQRYSSGHDLRKPMLHQHESICLEFPHLRDVILGMTPPPEVQDGWLKIWLRNEKEIDQPYELRTVPGSGMDNPS